MRSVASPCRRNIQNWESSMALTPPRRPAAPLQTDRQTDPAVWSSGPGRAPHHCACSGSGTWRPLPGINQAGGSRRGLMYWDTRYDADTCLAPRQTDTPPRCTQRAPLLSPPLLAPQYSPSPGWRRRQRWRPAAAHGPLQTENKG